MKLSSVVKPAIRIAVIETDPLRAIGFRALFESEKDVDLVASSSPEITAQGNIDVLLLGDRPGQNPLREIPRLKALHPDLPIIVVSPRLDDRNILSAITAGAKGYLCDGAPASEFAQAIRAVRQGSVWAPRHVLSMFMEEAGAQCKTALPLANEPLTHREAEVLRMLVTGLSNREISEPLGIEVRTVKAHISKIMRKTGVRNRIALSMHAITNSLVTGQTPPASLDREATTVFRPRP
jgi:DNA-binding NarL/FixJ family response regulator